MKVWGEVVRKGKLSVEDRREEGKRSEGRFLFICGSCTSEEELMAM